MNKEKLEKMYQESKCSKQEIYAFKGGVGKVTIYKNLLPETNPETCESGYIVLEKGAMIGNHKHVDNSETYKILCGNIEVNGYLYVVGDTHVCKRGDSHYCKNISNGIAIISFTKTV